MFKAIIHELDKDVNLEQANKIHYNQIQEFIGEVDEDDDQQEEKKEGIAVAGAKSGGGFWASCGCGARPEEPEVDSSEEE